MTVVAALMHTLTDRFLWDVIHIVCTCINDVMMTVTYDTRVLAAFVNSSGPTTSMHWLHTCIICIMFVVKSWSLLVTQCGAFFITTRAWRGCCKLVFIIKSSSTALAIVTNGHVRMCVRVVWLLREPQTPPHCLHTAKSCCVCRWKCLHCWGNAAWWRQYWRWYPHWRCRSVTRYSTCGLLSDCNYNYR